MSSTEANHQNGRHFSIVLLAIVACFFLGSEGTERGGGGGGGGGRILWRKNVYSKFPWVSQGPHVCAVEVVPNTNITFHTDCKVKTKRFGCVLVSL